MLEFIKDNWKLILEIVFALIILFSSIIRKKPVSNIQAAIYEFCIKAVNIVESENIKGSDEKLNTAVELVDGFLKAIYPDLNVDLYNGIIKVAIEDILSTPKKKGE